MEDTEASPLVTVVISTYREISDGTRPDGSDSTLARAVRSVLAQTYGRWELIVVSDHPPEIDRERIQALIEGLHEPRVSHHDMPERGGIALLSSAAKKAGIELGRGELVAFLEADNEWSPEILAQAVRAFEQDPDLDLVYFDSVVRLTAQAPGAPLISALSRMSPLFKLFGPVAGQEFRWSKPDWDASSRATLGSYNFIDASEAVFRRTSYDATGGIPLGVDSDWALWRRFLATGQGRFRHIPVVGSYYSTSSWEQHLNYFGLTMIQRFGLPFDMSKEQEKVRGRRNEAYGRKHET